MTYAVELSDRVVKAIRRRRLCEWCGESIEPGEPAHNRVYKYEGDLRNDYMHPECYAAMYAVDWYDFGDFEWMPGDFERGSSIPR